MTAAQANALAGASGDVCGSSVTGAAHRQRGAINQDACLSDTFGSWSLIAVADGHGSAPHFRSDRGSRLAVEAARYVLRAWAGESDPLQVASYTALPARIWAQWCAFVDVDLRLDPAPATAPADRFMPYGATLVAAVMSATHGLFLQIGDGDLVLDDGQGALTRPLPDDMGLVGEQTYSLCQMDAPRRFRVALHGLTPRATSKPFVMVATDGFQKSYGAGDRFLAAVNDWRALLAANGPAPATNGLDTWLADVSARGNGDDISAMFYTAR